MDEGAPGTSEDRGTYGGHSGGVGVRDRLRNPHPQWPGIIPRDTRSVSLQRTVLGMSHTDVNCPPPLPPSVLAI